MLPGSAEVRAAMNGLWLVLFQTPETSRDPMDYFQKDGDAFFRSFFVFFFALPIYVVMAHVQWDIAFTREYTNVPSLTYTAARVLGEAMQWGLFPLLVVLFSGHLKISNRFAPYIITINWSSLALALIFAPIYLLYLLGLAEDTTVIFLSVFLQLGSLWFLWKLTKVALKCDWLVAIELVVLILASGFFVSWLSDSLFGLSI